jgi:hypothetical protein
MARVSRKALLASSLRAVAYKLDNWTAWLFRHDTPVDSRNGVEGHSRNGKATLIAYESRFTIA